MKIGLNGNIEMQYFLVIIKTNQKKEKRKKKKEKKLLKASFANWRNKQNKLKKKKKLSRWTQSALALFLRPSIFAVIFISIDLGYIYLPAYNGYISLL